jgi:hypothetical protein
VISRTSFGRLVYQHFREISNLHLRVKRIRAVVLILFTVPGEGYILKCFPVCFFALLNTEHETFNALTLHGTDPVGISGNTAGLSLAEVWFKSCLRHQLSCQVFCDFIYFFQAVSPQPFPDPSKFIIHHQLLSIDAT